MLIEEWLKKVSVLRSLVFYRKKCNVTIIQWKTLKEVIIAFWKVQKLWSFQRASSLFDLIRLLPWILSPIPYFSISVDETLTDNSDNNYINDFNTMHPCCIICMFSHHTCEVTAFYLQLEDIGFQNAIKIKVLHGEVTWKKKKSRCVRQKGDKTSVWESVTYYYVLDIYKNTDTVLHNQCNACLEPVFFIKFKL